MHGDFGPQNMLFDTETAEVSAVLDWELAHLGDVVEDLAWAEWIVRTHHPALDEVLPALWDGYGDRPAWRARHSAMLAGCVRAAGFVRRWEPGGVGERQWAERIARTRRFRDL